MDMEIMNKEDLKLLIPIMRKGLEYKGISTKKLSDEKIITLFYNNYAGYFNSAYQPVNADTPIFSESAGGKTGAFATILSGISNFFTKLNNATTAFNNTSVDSVNRDYQNYIANLEYKYQNEIQQRNTVMYILIGVIVFFVLAKFLFKN